MDQKKTIFNIIKSKVKMNFDESSKIDSLDLDSLDLIEIVMEIETTFSIKIEDDKLNSIKTISDLLNIVNAKIK
ncbi:MAG: phosphopantetheine-binding protein [Metamycoplasmataceae bacterium]